MKGESRTKRRHDPDLTKCLILNAAKKEFAEKGVDGARIDQIAATAIVNKQLIYYYFENKDTLFTHVLQEAYQDLRTRVAALELAHLPARVAVLEFMDLTWN